MNEPAGFAGLRRRFQTEWAIVALVASLLVAGAVLGRWTQAADDLVYDAAMRAAPAPADPDLLIVAIDEPSLAALGRWPWSREVLARGLAALGEARPESVTVDILLSEPAPPDQDAALAQAMAALDRLYLPVQFVAPGRNGRAVDRLAPAAPLARAADALGHANTLIDRDGSVRSAALCFAPGENGAAVPHLMALAAGSDPGAGCERPRRLRFAAPESFASISFASVARGEVPAPLIAGRRVLIGMTAQGLGDRYPVPGAAGGNMPGVEINANIANALLHGLWLREPAPPVALALALAPAWLLLVAFWRIRPRHVVWLVVVLVLLVLGASLAGLAAGLWIAPGPALLGLALVYPLWGWRRLQATSDYMAEELDRLERDEALPIGETSVVAADLVTGQSRRLRHAIGQLRDLRRFVADTLAGLPDPVLVSDAGGTIVLVNTAAERAIGGDLVGRPVAPVLARIAEPGSTATVEAYLAAPGSDHIEFTTANGRCFVLRRAPILTAGGTRRGHVDYLTDISAIADARREREQILELLSHDMRAPQAAILAILADDGDAIDRARIARHARRTLALADNFVDLARMQERAFDPEPVLVADLASEAADSLWPLARQRGVRIDIDDRSDGAFVSAERESLFRALCNLIDNAVKYSPDGGVVTVALSVGERAMLVVRIADQGRGIDPAILPRLFQRFASSGDGGAVKGVGLGLSYIAAVIARHGGTIAGENAPDGGAVFTLTLPREE